MVENEEDGEEGREEGKEEEGWRMWKMSWEIVRGQEGIEENGGRELKDEGRE